VLRRRVLVPEAQPPQRRVPRQLPPCLPLSLLSDAHKHHPDNTRTAVINTHDNAFRFKRAAFYTMAHASTVLTHYTSKEIRATFSRARALS
jgi:hypothetical protein